MALQETLTVIRIFCSKSFRDFFRNIRKFFLWQALGFYVFTNSAKPPKKEGALFNFIQEISLIEQFNKMRKHIGDRGDSITDNNSLVEHTKYKFVNGVYWLIIPIHGDIGPFCTLCLEETGKPFHLHLRRKPPTTLWEWACRKCPSTYICPPTSITSVIKPPGPTFEPNS